MKRALCCLGLLVAWIPAWEAHAYATFQSVKRGSGFSDPTPLAAVGGNHGKTRGEQRRIAFDYALSLWAEKLESAVPIVVDVQFDDMGCGPGATVLAAAGPADHFAGLTGNGADSTMFYPSALADSLMERDLAPGDPDILMYINSQIDVECTGGYYYGLDSKADGQSDFVDVLLHELTHGLGFSSSIDPTTGELFANRGVDPFTARIRDLDRDLTWDRLTSTERRRSANNVRRLVFDGPRSAQLIPELAKPSPPQLTFMPTIAGYSGFVGDANVGTAPAEAGGSGQVVVADGCVLPKTAAGGSMVLFDACSLSAAARAAAASGAAAALIVLEGMFDLPPVPIDFPGTLPGLAFPVVSLTSSDGEAIRAAATTSRVTARLAPDSKSWSGADAQHRPLLFATLPADRGSSISHLDWSIRPNQLMEAVASESPKRDLSLTLAMLRDLGWPARCGDGHVDAGEECDSGPENNDTKADACRTNCRKPRCGDSVKDAAEGCDRGLDNRDDVADACRTSCRVASCGDGVIDASEQCDDGPANDDVTHGACRRSCKLAGCGDHVVDGIEQCDEGADNSDQSADACRRDCRLPRCGDGVVDRGETCDEGAENGKGSCRRDCSKPSCGDGIVDQGEACDGTSGCLPTCERTPPTPPSSASATAKPMRSQTSPDAGEAEDGGPSLPEARASDCGCQLSARAGSPAGWTACAVGLLIFGLRRGKRRREASARGS